MNAPLATIHYDSPRVTPSCASRPKALEPSMTRQRTTHYVLLSFPGNDAGSNNECDSQWTVAPWTEKLVLSDRPSQGSKRHRQDLRYAPSTQPGTFDEQSYIRVRAVRVYRVHA